MTEPIRVRDLLTGKVDLTRLEIQRGYLTSLPRDPGVDPPAGHPWAFRDTKERG